MLESVTLCAIDLDFVAIVKLILPFQMGVLVGIVELGALPQIQLNVHDLSSDSDLGFVLCDE